MVELSLGILFEIVLVLCHIVILVHTCLILLFYFLIIFKTGHTWSPNWSSICCWGWSWTSDHLVSNLRARITGVCHHAQVEFVFSVCIHPQPPKYVFKNMYLKRHRSVNMFFSYSVCLPSFNNHSLNDKFQWDLSGITKKERKKKRMREKEIILIQ